MTDTLTKILKRARALYGFSKAVAWEQGPRGGTRRKAGDKWVYRRGGGSPGASGQSAEKGSPAHEKNVLEGGLSKFPDGWEITDPGGDTHKKTGGEWVGGDGVSRSNDAFVEQQTGGDPAKVAAWKQALAGFVKELAPGAKAQWAVKLGKMQSPEQAPEKQPGQSPEQSPEQASERTAKQEQAAKDIEEANAKTMAKKAMYLLEAGEILFGQDSAPPMQRYLAERFQKGQQVGGKYIRRVPYTDASGKKKYRYYYRDSAAARDVQEGEDVRVGKDLISVLAVENDGTIRMKLDGHERIVSPREWSDLLANHYGDQFYAHAEKRARQTVNAVLRHVPRDLLKDLKGGTDEERLKDLEKRVPEVYEKLQAAFRRAGVNPFRAKTVIADSLQRKGWEPEARALVIGNIITPEGAKTVKNHRQISNAAENLAGGGKVETKHVAAALEMRKPRGKGDTFADKVADVAKQAEKEVAKLQALIKNAKKQKGMTAETAAVLAQALQATAMQQIHLLAQAFPGIQDKVVEPVRETLAEVPAVVPRPELTDTGAESHFFIAGEGGRPVAMKTTYKLMEAGDVVASHDPTKSFGQNAAYPEGVQERAYHRDTAEQNKVRRNAQGLAPAMVVNTNPDAVNGPPVVTKDGIVLGGNSRTMSMQVAYEDHPEKAEALKKYLAEQAHTVGLRPEDVKAFENPILVRVVEPATGSKEDLQRLVRGMNESFTQAMDPRTEQVAMGRKLDEKVLSAMTGAMQEGESLSEFLGTSRSRPLLAALQTAGIIDERNVNRYVNQKTQRLNSDGKTFISRILVGRAVDDADLLSETRPRMVESLARSVPYMMQAEKYGGGYNLTEDLRTALSALNELQDRVEGGDARAWKKDMDAQAFGELKAFFKKLPGIAEDHPILENDRAMTLLEVLVRKPGANQLAGVFKTYASLAAKNPEGQSSLMGQSRTPGEVFDDSIKVAIKKEAAEKAAEDAEKAAKAKKKAKEQKAKEEGGASEDNFETMPDDAQEGEGKRPFDAAPGRKYTYALTLRPVSTVTVPGGFEDFGKHPAFPHGTVTYDKPLSEGDVEHFSLKLFPETGDVDAVVTAAVESFSEYAKEYMEEEDPLDMLLPGIGQAIDRSHLHLTSEQIQDVQKRVVQGLRDKVSEDAAPEPKPGPVPQKTEEEHHETQSALADALGDHKPTEKEIRTGPAADLGIPVSEDDIPLDVATRAHSGTSMSPEVRGKQAQDEYVSVADRLAAAAIKAAGDDPDKRAQAEGLAREAIRGMRTRYLAMLHAKSGVMSTMITGPSKFPTARNQKRGDTADKRTRELVEYVDKQTDKIRNTLNPKSISADRPDAVIALEAKIQKMEKQQADWKKINKIVRSKTRSETQKKADLAAIGIGEATYQQLITPPYQGAQIGLPSYLLSNNLANIKRTKQRIKDLEREDDTPTAETEHEGVTVIDNAEDNRIQLQFDGKPSETIRSKMKSEGWRWSRREGVWQRQRTDAARQSAQRMVAALKEEAGPIARTETTADPVAALRERQKEERFAKWRTENADKNQTRNHPKAVAREDMDIDKDYAVFERVGGHWVMDRSYGGAYLRGDESHWREIKARAGTDRPMAIFDRGLDPNDAEDVAKPKAATKTGQTPLDAGAPSWMHDDVSGKELLERIKVGDSVSVPGIYRSGKVLRINPPSKSNRYVSVTVAPAPSYREWAKKQGYKVEMSVSFDLVQLYDHLKKVPADASTENPSEAQMERRMQRKSLTFSDIVRKALR